MRMIVLFNLKPGVAVAEYEAWAKTRDIPIVRALPSIDDFQVYRSTGLFGSDAGAPYAYVEIIDVADMDGFGKDIGTAAMQANMAEFNGFADAPAIILTEALSLV
ncbi:MAG: REDY-like protein HapK [Polymorphobacter sp.]